MARELDRIGVLEVIGADSRPTFCLDLDPDEVPSKHNVLSPCFGNVSLRSYEYLWDVVQGLNSDDEEKYSAFRDWAVSKTHFDDSGDIFPVTYIFCGMLWTGSTIRKRWRIISGNKLFDAKDTLAGDLSSGLPREIAGSDNPGAKRRRVNTGQASIEVVDTIIPEAPIESTVIRNQTTTRSSEQQDSSYSSTREKANALINLDVEHSAVDWTARRPNGALTAHAELARSIDWSATPLGAMRTWEPEFRQICNIMMKNPHPTALFWGSDLTMLYNEAYRDVVAGRKHPALLGSGFRGPFAETWNDLEDLFQECARTGNSISMENQQLPMERQRFLEETFFTWSFTPCYGSGKKVLGFLNLPFEVTSQVLAERRASTLLRLGEETAAAKSVSEFWQKVLSGLETNHWDIPVAILYSVVDADDGDCSSVSGSSLSFKSCQLEGTLGVPTNHPAAPHRLDLKRSTEGFVPSFREAMRTREPTTLHTKDGTLPESLIAGLEWRGWGEPCREAVIFPIRPTTGESVLGFLLMGINPRRPFDEGYKSFVNLLNHSLANSLASTLLFEDEIQRGRAAAEAAARERDRLSQQLVEQTLRMKQMALTSRVGMYYLSPAGVLLEANSTFYDLTGFQKHDHRELAFLEIVHPSSAEKVKEAWHAYTVEQVSWSGEWRLRKPWTDDSNGEIIENWILATGQPEFNEDKSVRCVTGSITNISRIKWAESLQTRRLAEAEETKRQTNNFLDLTSHEMRNPLSAMIHCADDIMQTLSQDKTLDPSTNESLYEAAETIAHCAQHQKSIVDDILTVSKLDANLLVITPAVVDPKEVGKQAMRMFETEMEKKAIKYEYQVDSSLDLLGNVYLDRSRVLQVLINLISNAIKFTQLGETRRVSLRIAASVKPPLIKSHFDFEFIARDTEAKQVSQENTYCLSFAVTDSGRGLTTEESNRLFRRFSQATPRTHAKYGGSGLGLFISKRITELHEGQIGVGSEAGVGSTFAFYVRCKKAPTEPGADDLKKSKALKAIGNSQVALPHRSSATDLTSAAVSNKTMEDLHVLVVEDNLVNQKVLCKQLQKFGCKVEKADHGEQALQHIEKTRYWTASKSSLPLSVVLMDLEMPVMDGLTCVKRIRSLEKEGQIKGRLPVIAVTANVRAELVASALEAGMDDVVCKPFRIPELMKSIAQVLEKK